MKLRRTIDRIVLHGTEVLALGTAGIGLFALGTWVAGRWWIASFGSGYVPMAPDTAALFVLLGLGLGACHRWPQGRTARVFARAAAIVAVVVSSLVAAKTWWHFSLPWETWLAEPNLRLGAIPLGQMSPVTAFVFLLAAGSLLARVAGPAHQGPLRWGAAFAAGAGLLVALVVVAGYVAGTPLLYGGYTVPMAWSTAIGFVGLNLGLLLFPGAAGAGLNWFPPGAEAGGDAAQRRFARNLLIVSAGLVFAISLAGFVYLKREQADARDGVYEKLNAVADLKIRQIANWRHERLSDGRFLLRAPFVAEDVAALRARPESEAARARVFGWLNQMKSGDRYESVLVLDPAGRVLLAIPETSLPPGPRTQELLTTASGSRDTTLTDLHRADGTEVIPVDVVTPVFAPGAQPAADTVETSPGAAPAPPIAVILLQLNPERFLFPLIQSWPVPSETAEILLVRREGNEVVFLNPLRHRRNTALGLRHPVDSLHLPAAQAVRGETGVREGIDYRGTPVLAAFGPVPDSPWYLIAKIDRAEVFAPIRREAWRSGAVLGTLLVAVVLAAAYLWRQRHAALLSRELALAERLAAVMRHANDIILSMDEDGRILEANERALLAYGYSLEEMRALPPGGLRAPGAKGSLTYHLAQLRQAGSAVFETVHQRRDGTMFPVEASGRAVEVEGRRVLLGVYRDVTQRKAYEAEIERLNRLYAALSQVNQVIVRATTREELFRAVCRVIVEFGRFRLAWVGWREPETARVVPVTVFGDTDGFLDEIKAGDFPADSPIGVCLREGRTYVCNDILLDPRTLPRREAASRRGIRASIALPVRKGAEVVAVLVTYATEPGVFADKEVALLEEAAGDLGFGLERLANSVALRESEMRFHALFEYSLDGMLLTIPDGRILAANPAACRILGRTEAEICRIGHQDLIDVTDPRLDGLLAERARTGQAQGEISLVRGDGSRVEAEISSVVFESAEGARSGMVIRDITERKRAGDALRRAEEQYRSIFENALEGIFQSTPQGTFLAVNPAMARIFGYESPEAFVRARTAAARRGYVDPRRRAEFVRRIEADGVVTGFESEVYRQDGSTIWVSENARVVRDAQGRVLCYEGSLEDITARRQSEAKIVDQLDELRRWHEAMLGREDRVIEMKREVNALLARRGEPPRYSSAKEEEA